ncbi:MAG: hypothetical protein RhofKO_31950 [Rhodothermales bacterium]
MNTLRALLASLLVTTLLLGAFQPPSAPSRSQAHAHGEGRAHYDGHEPYRSLPLVVPLKQRAKGHLPSPQVQSAAVGDLWRSVLLWLLTAQGEWCPDCNEPLDANGDCPCVCWSGATDPDDCVAE